MQPVFPNKYREAFGIANRAPAERIESSLCFAITLFYEGTLQENATGLSAVLDWALGCFGDRIRFTDVGGKFRLRKFRPSDRELLASWLAEPAPVAPGYGLIFSTADRKQDVSADSFHLWHFGAVHPAFVRLTLPVEDAFGQLEQIIHRAGSAAAGMRFLTGYGGLCLATYLYGGWTEEGPLFKLSNRFHGVDFADPYRMREYQAWGINCVNWLTWVGARFLDRLPKGIEDQVVAPSYVMRQGNGMLFRAGPRPLWGDGEIGDDLSSYFAVGNLLRPVRYPIERLGRDGCIGGHDNTRRWLGRFDRGSGKPKEV